MLRAVGYYVGPQSYDPPFNSAIKGRCACCPDESVSFPFKWLVSGHGMPDCYFVAGGRHVIEVCTGDYQYI